MNSAIRTQLIAQLRVHFPFFRIEGQLAQHVLVADKTRFYAWQRPFGGKGEGACMITDFLGNRGWRRHPAQARKIAVSIQHMPVRGCAKIVHIIGITRTMVVNAAVAAARIGIISEAIVKRNTASRMLEVDCLDRMGQVRCS